MLRMFHYALLGLTIFIFLPISSYAVTVCAPPCTTPPPPPAPPPSSDGSPPVPEALTVRLSTINGASENATILGSTAPGAQIVLTAQVYDSNNQPVPNVKVQLHLEAVYGSGGHNHGDNNASARTGTLIPWTGQVTGTGQDVEGYTDLPFGLPFTYQAPKVGGDINITATCLSCTPQGPTQVWVGHILKGTEIWVSCGLTCITGSNSDWTVLVEERHKGLYPLDPSSPYSPNDWIFNISHKTTAAVYRLVGGTDLHLRGANHYLTPVGIIRASEFAAVYAAFYPGSLFYAPRGKPLLNGQPALYFNDASLERGGFFDLDGNWKPPHHEHCRGTAIDVRANGVGGALNVTSDFAFTYWFLNRGGPVDDGTWAIWAMRTIGAFAGVDPQWEVPNVNGKRMWDLRHFHTHLNSTEGLQCP